ncbi:unnamed protein product [Ceutorhynchus assimilis]|uniref:BRISC and BRCA1-A complex member 2 n=1 Tax=Ceutorhynchus assimilis TaxID=467358 RepID=A0A9N9MEV8_9CUCU|nr:unnamed protein product [Ceutorhynchus assimilis]
MSSLSNAQYVEHNLTTLSEPGRIGLSKFQATKVRPVTNNYVELRFGFQNYHYQVEIPYAGSTLNWSIIFDLEDYGELPDFEFDDETFLPEPNVELIANEIPSWDMWDLTNPLAVTNILNEFLALYKKTQLEKLMKFSHINKEYEDLLNKFGLSSDSIEVLIEKKPGNINYRGYDLINFLVHLPVDFKKSPYYQQEAENLGNPGEDFVYIKVQIRIRPDNEEQPRKIFLNTVSPRVQQLLETLEFPKFSNRDSLSTYTGMVQDFIESNIK